MEIGKIKSFLRAYATFHEIVKKPFIDDAILRDAAIQRFEYTVEAAWKALKEILREKFAVDVNSPITTFREAFAQELVSEDDMWITMVKARNETTHIYKEQNAIDIAKQFTEFDELLSELAETLQTYAGDAK